MFDWISTRVSFKIVIAVIAVLVLIMVSSTFVIVERRADVLQQELLVKGRTLAKTGAKAMEIILEDAMKSEQLTREELFDTDYKPITEGPLAGAAIPKYHTAYDQYLDERIRAYEDAFVESDDMVVFTVLVDKNGYLPTHNTKYNKPLTGDPDKDRVGNRTKRIFNDPTGIAAARYDNEDGKGFLLQDYKRDTGVTMWDVSAPVYVDGEHWGGFRIGYSMELAEAAIRDLRQDFIIMMLSVLLIAGITTYLVVGRITRPLKELTQTADEIAEGNLEKQIEIRSNDEVGQLARAFNKMTQVIVKNLQEEIEKSNRMVASIKEAVKQLSQSGKGLMEIANQQAAGATEQAAAVQQATTTSEEIAATAKQVAENAGRVAKLADHSSTASTAGQTAVSDAVDGMSNLKQQVQSIAEAMLQLGENSQKIGGIIDIIDEISDQTNLLSLNAAIEAAGAGEAGKRFAIVANEVRRLADRTVDATNQVKNLIAQIQQATNSTIMLTEEGTKGVDSASEKVGNISHRLEEITQAVGETTAAVTEIELMTQQQTTASEQMADTIVEVRDVANQFAAGTHETTQSLADLTSLAERLRDMVEEDMLAEVKLRVPHAARELGEKFEGLVESGLMPLDDLFDEDYQIIPGTDPVKYHTRYDSIFDEILQDYLDNQLNDEKIIYAVVADRNGYVPTHNSRYSKALTGDYQQDVTGNRTKRMFNDPVGLAAARFEGDKEHPTLQQVYERDTGEKMLDVSAPIIVDGKHWGAFRIGYQVD